MWIACLPMRPRFNLKGIGINVCSTAVIISTKPVAETLTQEATAQSLPSPFSSLMNWGLLGNYSISELHTQLPFLFKFEIRFLLNFPDWF